MLRMLERIAEKVGARTEIDAQSESSSAGEQRLENKPIRHTCFSHLAWMSFQTDTPKPTKTNFSADGSENELPGDRQSWNSIRRESRLVVLVVESLYSAGEWSDSYEDAALRRRSTASFAWRGL